MDERPVVVVARVVALPGREAEVEALLRGLLVPTRTEEGCVRYDLHRSRRDPRTFWFLEAWTSEAALDRHLASAHLEAARARFPELLAEEPLIERLDRIG